MKFAAFLSYSRSDERLARWLQRALESYATPNSLVGTEGARGPIPRRIAPIFRDRTDLPAYGGLDAALSAALADSEVLIVLCSPAAAQSKYVEAEVQRFIDLGRANAIFPVIASGKPNSTDPTDECFPPALRSLDLIAADLRATRTPDGKIIGDGRELGRLKLISGLLGTTLDSLIHRERRRQRAYTAIAGLGAMVFLAIAVAAGVFYWNSRRSLDSFFAVNAWQAIGYDDPDLAMKYALAGSKVSVSGRDEFAPILAVTAWMVGNGRFVIDASAWISGEAISPDGRELALAQQDHVVTVWDLTTRHQIAQLSLSQAEPDHIAWSPDGRFVAFGLDNGRVGVWEPAKGGAARSMAVGKAGVDMAVFSADGSKILAASTDGFVSLLDSTTGSIAYSQQWDGQSMNSARFSPDGRSIIAASDDGSVRILKASNGALIRSVLVGADVGVEDARYSIDGEKFVTAGTKGDAQVWQAASGKLMLTLTGHTSDLTSASFSPDGSLILTGSWDGSGAVWDAKTGERLSSFECCQRPVEQAEFEPDGKGVILAGSDASAYVIALSQLGGVTDISSGGQFYVGYTAEGLTGVAQTLDGKIEILDGETGAVRSTMPKPVGKISEASLSKDGKLLFVIEESNRAYLLDTSNWSVAMSVPPNVTWLNKGAVSDDDQELVAGGIGGHVILWGVKGGVQQSTLGDTGEIATSLAFSGDRKVLLDDGVYVNIFDTREQEFTMQRKVSDTGFSFAAGLSPQGDRIVVAGQNATIRILSIPDGATVTTLKGNLPHDIDSVIYSPDGRMIALLAQDGGVSLWDARSGEPLLAPDGHYYGPLSPSSFSPDGSKLALRSSDGVGIVDLSIFKTPLEVLAGNACSRLLGQAGRRFSPSEVQADPLLRAEWSDPSRDLCR